MTLCDSNCELQTLILSWYRTSMGEFLNLTENCPVHGEMTRDRRVPRAWRVIHPIKLNPPA